MIVKVRNRQHVFGSHPRGKQTLVSVPHRRISDQNPLLGADPLHCRLSSVTIQDILGIDDWQSIMTLKIDLWRL